MHGINWRSRNPIELSGPENSALCLADRTAQSIRRRSENTYAVDLRDATLTERDADMSTRASKCADEFGISRDNVLAVLQVVRRDELISTLGLDEEA